ncbi:MAG: hypothetical protein LBE85_07410 [Candidatus Accumulibacter sp.]|jgi:hypothetical protein|nr:hypothetical protein [Accumulibacter sp.]
MTRSKFVFQSVFAIICVALVMLLAGCDKTSKLTFEEYVDWFKKCGYATLTLTSQFDDFFRSQLGGGKRFMPVFSGDMRDSQDAVLVEFASEIDYNAVYRVAGKRLLRNGMVGIVAFKDDPYLSAAFSAFKDAGKDVSAKNYAIVAKNTATTKSNEIFNSIIAKYKDNGFKVDIVSDKSSIASLKNGMGGGIRFAFIYSKSDIKDEQALLIEYTEGDLKFGNMPPALNPPALFHGNSKYKRGRVCLWPLPEHKSSDVIDFWMKQ